MLWCLLSPRYTPHPGVETDITMTTSVDTGGGSQIGGNVSAGRDFVGRDQLNLTLSKEAAEALLPAAARRGDPDAYLGALLVHPSYAGWARRYVPLAGALTPWDTPHGWGDIEPELTALVTSGEGAARQVKRVPLADIREAVARHNARVLLGEPGSGKTTTLYRLLIDLARERLQTGAGPLPLLLSLADYRNYSDPHALITNNSSLAPYPLIRARRSLAPLPCSMRTSLRSLSMSFTRNASTSLRRSPQP